MPDGSPGVRRRMPDIRAQEKEEGAFHMGGHEEAHIKEQAAGFAALPCPLVEIAGPPGQRGRQYGEQAKSRILKGIDHYSVQLERSKVSWNDIERLVARFEPMIAAFDASYLEEMRGIAEGAGVSHAAIVLLNARTEILKLAQRAARGEAEPDDPDGCTGVVALPEITSNGRLVHALNWDWKAECAETAIVLKVRRDDGPDFITFTEAGGLARAGFNAAGISLTANYLECDRDYRRIGVPLALIRRKVLEQSHLALAMHAVYTTAKTAANNVILAHANGVVVDFECAPDETFQVHARDGLLVHANHFVSPVALSKLVDYGVPNMPDSLYRDLRVRDLIVPHRGSVTTDIVKSAMFDDFETPWAVCRPPRRSFTNNLSATVAMLVMEPSEGVMEVAMLPALNRQFEVFRLEMDVQVPNAAPAAYRAA